MTIPFESTTVTWEKNAERARADFARWSARRFTEREKKEQEKQVKKLLSITNSSNSIEKAGPDSSSCTILTSWAQSVLIWMASIRCCIRHFIAQRRASNSACSGDRTLELPRKPNIRSVSPTCKLKPLPKKGSSSCHDASIRHLVSPRLFSPSASEHGTLSSVSWSSPWLAINQHSASCLAICIVSSAVVSL